jgi:hypothetical protein
MIPGIRPASVGDFGEVMEEVPQDRQPACVRHLERMVAL